MSITSDGRRPAQSPVLALLTFCFVLMIGVVGTYLFLRSIADGRGSATPPTVAGYYWCSTDPDMPVLVWNDGTSSEPVWMVQHISGQGDGYHSTKYCTCRWSPRLINPLEENAK